MKIGFVVLAHDNIFRLRQVVRFLAGSGAPVALHLDKKASSAIREMLIYSFSDLQNVIFVDPIPCDWGDWSLVQATINASKALIETFPEVDYVQNFSGSCLPVQSVSEMESFLTKQTENFDYIESFNAEHHNWVTAGLSTERTSLYHPFNWRTSRRLFDLNVKIQRLLKINRTPPQNIEIAFGSQWWCLRVKTLKAIFDHTHFDEFVQFFKKSWIPDECFFQTLVGHISDHISHNNLTYANFDHTGKPFIFYDDHLDTLAKLDRFFVRKVWQGADELYGYFLNPFRAKTVKSQDGETNLTLALNEAKFRATQSRKGLISQFRFPAENDKIETCQPYHIHIGMEAFRSELTALYKTSDSFKLFGHLFKRNLIQDSPNAVNNTDPNMPLWRDYTPGQFLTQKIWYSQPTKIAFFANADQIKTIIPNLAADPHCEIFMVEGAWLFNLVERNITNLRRIKALCQIELKREKILLQTIRKQKNLANLNIFPIGMILDTEKCFDIKDVGQISLKLNEELILKVRMLCEQIRQNGIDIEHLGVSAEPNPLNMPNVIELKKYKKSS